MPQLFQCPSCQAPLSYEPGEKTVRCAYCGNTAIVPEPLRPKEPEPAARGTSPQVVVVSTSAERGGGGCVAGLLTLVFTLLVMGGVLWVVGASVGSGIAGFTEGMGSIGTQVAVGVSSVPRATATPGVAELLSTVGSEGTGAGLLDDAREIGVDGAGTLYVADYSSGRIQRFDAAGEYQGQWMVVNDLNAVTHMAVARDGTVLVTQGFDVYRYEGATGTHLDLVRYTSEGTVVLEGAVPLPDGGLLINERGESLVWLDGAGNVVRRADVPGRERGSSFERPAVDGQGNVFVLGRLGERGALNDGVFRYDASGEYLGFFGGSGDEPGQLRAPDAIAVDGRGRVFVSDIHGVHLYDPTGRYLATISVEGVPFGMAFDGENDLWVTNRNQLFEFRLTGP